MIKKSEQINYIIKHLSPENSAIYASLPEGVARQLTLDRDPHGNVQVSLIETEKLLGEMVGRRLAEMKAEGKFVGKFATHFHFFALRRSVLCATGTWHPAPCSHILGLSFYSGYTRRLSSMPYSTLSR